MLTVGAHLQLWQFHFEPDAPAISIEVVVDVIVVDNADFLEPGSLVAVVLEEPMNEADGLQMSPGLGKLECSEFRGTVASM